MGFHFYQLLCACGVCKAQFLNLPNFQPLNHISELFLAQFIPSLVSAVQRDFCVSQPVIHQGKVLSKMGTRKPHRRSHNLIAHSIENLTTQYITVPVHSINLTERKLKAFEELKWPDCIQTIEFTHMRI